MEQQSLFEMLLGNFDSMTIAIGFPIPFLLFFIRFNYAKIPSIGRLFFFAFLIYGISIITGMTSGMAGWLGDKPSAVLAGVIAPILYSVLTTGLINRWYQPKKELTDHLIDS